MFNTAQWIIEISPGVRNRWTEESSDKFWKSFTDPYLKNRTRMSPWCRRVSTSVNCSVVRATCGVRRYSSSWNAVRGKMVWTVWCFHWSCRKKISFVFEEDVVNNFLLCHNFHFWASRWPVKIRISHYHHIPTSSRNPENLLLAFAYISL
jgi:hypothetical protein